MRYKFQIVAAHQTSNKSKMLSDFDSPRVEYLMKYCATLNVERYIKQNAHLGSYMNAGFFRVLSD